MARQRERNILVRRVALGLGGVLVSGLLVLGLVGSPLGRGTAAASAPSDSASAEVVVQSPPAPQADGAAPTTGALAAPATDPSAAAALPTPAQDFTFDDYYVHVPAGAKDPAPVLVALHGMGGDGPGACDGVHAWADQQGWVLVGPTFDYGNWTDPEEVAREGPHYLPRLAQILDELPDRIGHPVQPQVTLYGFSRGAQLAQRFALLYPERVKAAVIMSAGTYTLPLREAEVNGKTQALKFPFGIADVRARFGQDVDLDAVRHVPFWIAVGAEDNDPSALPPQWSPLLGNTRVERARHFAAILRELQVPVQETEFPGLGHDIGSAEHDQALAWVSSIQ